jgi:hypothetical protein
MSKNLWLPFWISIALLLCAIPMIGILPKIDSAQSVKKASTEQGNTAAEEADPLLGERNPSPERFPSTLEIRPGIFQKVSYAGRKMARLASGRRNFQILLCSMFLTALASSDTSFLVQYISKRYNWTFAEAGYMLSAKAIVNFTLLAIVVPRVIRASMSSKTVHNSEVRLNFLGAEASILVSVVGVLCIALAFKFWLLLIGKYLGSVKAESCLL